MPIKYKSILSNVRQLIANFFFSLKHFLNVIKSISWIFKILKWKRISVQLIDENESNLSFRVSDENDMAFLWNNGFFGKGNLSRSEPTWALRRKKKMVELIQVNDRLSVVDSTLSDSDIKEMEKISLNSVPIPNNNSHNLNTVFSEDLTSVRRKMREFWKGERDNYIKLENKIKQSSNGKLTKEQEDLLDTEWKKMSLMKDEMSKGLNGFNLQTWDALSGVSSLSPNSSATTESSKRANSNNSKTGNSTKDSNFHLNTIENLEYLELTPFESLFLFELGIINIPNYNVHSLTIKLVQLWGFDFLIEYAAFYHYKALGWCVKPGLKFSADFVLYARGPPFTHAEFAIKIVRDRSDGTFGSNGPEDWIDYSATYRVVANVKKKLILCFVRGLEGDELLNAWENFKKGGNLTELLNRFCISEIGFKRWSPSKTRM